MITLTQITQDTCVNEITALRNRYLTRFQEQHCRECKGDYDNCSRYRAIRNTGMRFAHLRLYGGRE